MFSDHDLLGLVGEIYESAVDPQGWDAFLSHLAHLGRGTVAAITYHDSRQSEHFVSAQVGIPPEFQQLYREHYGATDEWLRGAQNVAHAGWVGTGQTLVPDAALVKSEFYNDHLRLMDDAFHLCAAQLFQTGSALGVISLVRRRKSGPFGERQLGLLRLLLPHLRCAIELHGKFTALRNRSAMLESALDLVETAIAFVDATGSIIAANGAADTLLKQADGLLSTRQGLRAGSARESMQLEKLVRADANTGAGSGLHAGGIVEVSRKPPKRPLVLLVAPVRLQLPSPFSKQAAAVIFIKDPDSRIEPAGEVLQRLYGITPAEHELTMLLVQGRSLQQAADIRQITKETARWHLKNIFRKTNVTSQSQLVRLLLLLPATLPTAKS
jgi:DNA-binding CsgD family transcriptional regulator